MISPASFLYAPDKIFIQRIHIDQHGARRIDEHCGGLHHAQLLLADDRRVACTDAPVQGDEIAAAQQFLLADRFAAGCCDSLCRDERVADQDLCAEDLQPIGDQTADRAKADDADVRAAQLRNGCGIRIFSLRRPRAARAMFLDSAIIRPIAYSATAMALFAGQWITLTPCSCAAFRSMFSTPPRAERI